MIVLFSAVAPLRSPLGFSGRSRAGNINLRWSFACVSFFLYVLLLPDVPFMFYFLSLLSVGVSCAEDRAGFISTLCKENLCNLILG